MHGRAAVTCTAAAAKQPGIPPCGAASRGAAHVLRDRTARRDGHAWLRAAGPGVTVRPAVWQLDWFGAEVCRRCRVLLALPNEAFCLCICVLALIAIAAVAVVTVPQQDIVSRTYKRQA